MLALRMEVVEECKITGLIIEGRPREGLVPIGLSHWAPSRHPTRDALNATAPSSIFAGHSLPFFPPRHTSLLL